MSFLEVKLLKAESFRNYIFDIQRIKKYLVQVAPLPFDPEQFSFHGDVHSFLADNVPQYGEYKITIIEEQLYRPYQDNSSYIIPFLGKQERTANILTITEGEHIITTCSPHS